jgi:ketol-acid reductoisomerase
MTVGPKIIDDRVEDNMREALKAIQNGEFAKGWIADYDAGSKEFQRLYDECKNLEIEKVGKKVRQMSGLEE